jgi:hypothetical protein
MAHAIIRTCGELLNPAEVVLDLSRQKVLVTNAVSRDRATLGELIGDHRFVLATTDAEVKQAKDHAQAIVFAHFRGDTRLKANVEQVTALGLDFDALDEDSAAAVRSRLHELGAAFVRYTTLSHGRAAGTHSFRAMLPISRAMSTEEFERVAPQLHARFPECDVQARDSARAWLLPMALAGGASPEREFHPGRVIDVDAMLAQSVVSAVSSPTKPTRAKAPASAGSKRGQKGPRHEEAEVSRMLVALSADCDRTTWLKVGFALCEWDEVEGRRLWQDWSATGGGQYAGEAETQRVWEHEVVPRVNSHDAAYRFDIDGLAKLAQEGGWRPPTMIPGKNGGRAKVYLSDGDGDRNTRDVGADALKLLGAHPDCFLFKDKLSRVVDSDRRAPKMSELMGLQATNILCDAANWAVHHRSGERRIGKPRWQDVEAWLELARENEFEGCARRLKGLASVPYIGRDGVVRAAAGYDATTKILLADHGIKIELDIPSDRALWQSTAKAAAQEILSHFDEVPFRGPEDQTAFLSLLASIISQPLLEGAPMPAFLLDANARGAGKTRLAEIAVMLLTGSRKSLGTLPGREEEIVKFLLAEARSGASFVCFDNVKTKIGGPALESAITQGGTRGRILNTSTIADIDFAPCWMFTSNNASLTTDMVSRVISIYLFVTVAEPRGQLFKVSEAEWWGTYMPNVRGRLVSLLLLILKLHAMAGYPRMPRPVGSFGEWEKYIASAVWYATGILPTETQKRLRFESDDETSFLVALLQAWPRGKGLYARHLVADATLADINAGVSWSPAQFKMAMAPFVSMAPIPHSPGSVSSVLFRFRDRLVPVGPDVYARLEARKDTQQNQACFHAVFSAESTGS